MSIEKLSNKVSSGVKKNNSTNRLIIVCFSVCFLAMLFWNYKVQDKYRKNNIVISQNGKVIPYQIMEKEALLSSTISVHCQMTSNLLNSFDRISLKSNQAKSLFLVERNSAMPIFKYYKKAGIYNQVLQLGYSYKNEFKKMSKLNLETYPYEVEFYSVTKIYNGGILENEVLIKSKGKLSTIEANFEQSPQGYYFTDYTQEYSAVNKDNDE